MPENQKKMINTRLILIEHQARLDEENHRSKLEAIASLKEVLSRIDITAEMLPLGTESEMKVLLSSIKGDQLSKEENEIITEITNHLPETVDCNS